MVTGKGGAGLRSEEDKARVRRTREAKGQFDYRVKVGGEDGDISQTDTNPFVQTPVDEGQEDQIEFFLAEEGSRLEEGIEERVAKGLDPENSICAPGYQRSQKLVHGHISLWGGGLGAKVRNDTRRELSSELYTSVREKANALAVRTSKAFVAASERSSARRSST
jgi:hypothetical protein